MRETWSFPYIGASGHSLTLVCRRTPCAPAQHILNRTGTQLAASLVWASKQQAIRRAITLLLLHGTACMGFYGALEDPVLLSRLRAELRF